MQSCLLSRCQRFKVNNSEEELPRPPSDTHLPREALPLEDIGQRDFTIQHSFLVFSKLNAGVLDTPGINGA